MKSIKNKLLLKLLKLINTTNHKDIGILYILFGLIAGIIGTIFSILNGDWQFYNVIIIAHAFVMVMPVIIVGFGNCFILLLIIDSRYRLYIKRCIKIFFDE